MQKPELNMTLKKCNKYIGEIEWVKKKVKQEVFYMLQEFWEEWVKIFVFKYCCLHPSLFTPDCTVCWHPLDGVGGYGHVEFLLTLQVRIDIYWLWVWVFLICIKLFLTKCWHNCRWCLSQCRFKHLDGEIKYSHEKRVCYLLFKALHGYCSLYFH